MDYKLLLIAVIFHFTAGNEIFLEHLGTVYVPFEGSTFRYDAGVAEQIAVEKDRAIAYTIGNNLIHVIDFSVPETATVVDAISAITAGSGSLEDVTFCRDWVAVCVDSTEQPLNSSVLVFSKYSSNDSPSMQKLHTISVGSLPDSAKFTSDCSKLLVAIEGEVRNVEGTVVDPEGGVMVIDFGPLGPHEGNMFLQTFLDFTSFNERAADYIARGVRKTFDGQGTSDIASTTFSQDLEPENIVLSEDELYAYVPLQENNAMAVLDLTSLAWVDIYPLGTKSFHAGNAFGSKLDASDRDDAINIAHWPIQALFQPDGVGVFEWNGQSYIVTANEGDDRSYEVDDLGMDQDWEESDRGRDLRPFLSASVSQEVRDMLGDRPQLGRLKLSLVDGLDSQGNIENLTMFGGRSVSIFSAGSLGLVDDTGSVLAEAFAAQYPFVFNGDGGDDRETPLESKDSRSDNRGVEPEAIELGQLDDDILVFAGLERPGAIAVFSVQSAPSSTEPRLALESLYYGGGQGKTWGQMYAERTAHALDVEDLAFIPATRSPTGRPMLVAAGSVSGTLSFFHVTRGYSCRYSNPCRIPPSELYYQHYEATMFIQCSAFGSCYEMPCAPGTVWSQGQNTCAHAQ